MTKEERLKVNILRIQRGILIKELEDEFNQLHVIPSYDALIQMYLYCDYHCGDINPQTTKANQIQEMTFEIDSIDGIDNFSSWKICSLYLQNNINYGKYQTPETIQKAAELLTFVEERLEEYSKQSPSIKPQTSEIKQVFVSYSHKDEKWLNQLKIHFKPVERKFKVIFWDDSHIPPGSLWQQEIEVGIRTSKVFVLLISANFFASDFITDYELPKILERAELNGNIILPLILSPCRFNRDPILPLYQAINTPDRPVSSLNENEQLKVFDRLAKIVEGILLGEEMDG